MRVHFEADRDTNAEGFEAHYECHPRLATHHDAAADGGLRCQFANDGVCDELDAIHQTGVCAPGTDTSDCFSESCHCAGDRECDENDISSDYH